MVTTPLIIPIVLWGAAILVSGFALKKIFFSDEEEEKINNVKEDLKSLKKISILGLHKSGKTTLLNFLKGNKNYKNLDHVGTGIEEYESFDMKFNDKTITIEKNYDLGGADTYVNHYQKNLENTTLSFFLFNIYSFLNDENYFREFCARIDYLKDINTTKIYFIATHPDKLSSDKDVQIKVSEKLINKHYKSYVETNLIIINLHDEAKLTAFFNKIFSYNE